MQLAPVQGARRRARRAVPRQARAHPFLACVLRHIAGLCLRDAQWQLADRSRRSRVQVKRPRRLIQALLTGRDAPHGRVHAQLRTPHGAVRTRVDRCASELHMPARDWPPRLHCVSAR